MAESGPMTGQPRPTPPAPPSTAATVSGIAPVGAMLAVRSRR